MPNSSNFNQERHGNDMLYLICGHSSLKIGVYGVLLPQALNVVSVSCHSSWRVPDIATSALVKPRTFNAYTALTLHRWLVPRARGAREVGEQEIAIIAVNLAAVTSSQQTRAPPHTRIIVAH